MIRKRREPKPGRAKERVYETAPFLLAPSAQRSALMKRVRQVGTTPELAVRKALFDIGARYRVNVDSLPGRPDIANQSRRKAIFVHGCFWHSHSGCARGTIPKSNSAFWADKLRRNVERDTRKMLALHELGFQVCCIWECELSDTSALRRRLREFWRQPD
jgi:DNA mismatch endonuclease (patch repair protein)